MRSAQAWPYLLLALACREARALPDKALPLPDARGSSPLGTNLTLVTDWSAEWPFTDAFKTSRAWISGNDREWKDPRPLDLDDRGWVRSLLPGQMARGLMFWHPGLSYPSGDYTVLYSGQGSLSYSSNVERIGASKGRELIRVNARQGGILLNITATQPGDPLRDVQVLLPGGACAQDRWCGAPADCPQGQRCRFFPEEAPLFHPSFLASLAGYSTLRFMDWMATDEASVVQRDWTDRPRLEDVRWTEKGVPLEVMISLANQLGADPWFCIHHLAGEDYIRRFAELVASKLDKRLKVYVEHSNEVWNQEYAQARHAAERGLAEKLSPNKFEAQLRWHAARSLLVFKLFTEALGKERLVRVMGAQAANTWASETLLGFKDAARSTDALAIAPYFGGYLGTAEQAERLSTLKLDDLMSELAQVAVPRALDLVQAQAAVAKRFGVALIAYEGGQHLVGVGPRNRDDRLNALFDAANRDPRMKALYASYLAGWKERGGRLFVHYQSTNGYSQWGRFGARESLEQPRAAAPKYDALMEFVEKQPRWW